MQKVSLSVLEECFLHTAGRVTYLYGSKPVLGSDSSTFHTADCSGFSEWILDRAGYTLTGDSQQQWATCAGLAAQGSLHQLAHYSDVNYAKNDPSRLFIAFMRANPVGHVWLLRADGKGNMMTMECHGGNPGGVSSRPWQSLENVAAACYELPTTD